MGYVKILQIQQPRYQTGGIAVLFDDCNVEDVVIVVAVAAAVADEATVIIGKIVEFVVSFSVIDAEVVVVGALEVEFGC